jgi:hypothetical protein
LPQVSASVTANYLAGFQAFGKADENKQEYEKMEVSLAAQEDDFA